MDFCERFQSHIRYSSYEGTAVLIKTVEVCVTWHHSSCVLKLTCRKFSHFLSKIASCASSLWCFEMTRSLRISQHSSRSKSRKPHDTCWTITPMQYVFSAVQREGGGVGIHPALWPFVYVLHALYAPIRMLTLTQYSSSQSSVRSSSSSILPVRDCLYALPEHGVQGHVMFSCVPCCVHSVPCSHFTAFLADLVSSLSRWFLWLSVQTFQTQCHTSSFLCALSVCYFDVRTFPWSHFAALTANIPPFMSLIVNETAGDPTATLRPKERISYRALFVTVFLLSAHTAL